MRMLIRFMFGLIVVSALLAAGTETAEPLAVHHDSKMLERAALKAVRAFLRDDIGEVRNWLNLMEQSSRPLDHDRDAAYGPQIIDYSQSFHGTLERTQQLAAAGNIDKAFEQYKWTQRCCIDCHRKAREQGLHAGPDKETRPPG